MCGIVLGNDKVGLGIALHVDKAGGDNKIIMNEGAAFFSGSVAFNGYSAINDLFTCLTATKAGQSRGGSEISQG